MTEINGWHLPRGLKSQFICLPQCFFELLFANAIATGLRHNCDRKLMLGSQNILAL